jgi:small-conductance mechanosensitive channel
MHFGLAAAVGTLLPNITYTIPFFGSVDFTPYVATTVLFVGLTIIFKIVQVIVVARLKALSRKTSTDIDDVVIDAIASIKPWVYTFVAFFVAAQTLTLPHWLDMIFTALFLFAVVWQAIEIAVCFVDYFTKRVLEKDEDGDGQADPNSAMAANMVALLARIVLWTFGILFVLSNLGIEITSLIAGLGIGGVAVAFALQGILTDLFSSFSLYFDKPFRIGDYIIIGDNDGVVEKIGIKTTRIRTLQGEELVVSNAELTSTRVQNFKKMQERRIASRFGVIYETPYETMKEIPGMIERIFEAVDGARLDRVHFTEFGDSALLFDFVYYVASPDYAKYMDIQQQINFEIMSKFAETGIEFAYPTQTLYVKKS